MGRKEVLLMQLILEHGTSRSDRRFTPVASVFQAADIIRSYPRGSGAYGVLRRGNVAIKGWRLPKGECVA